MISSVWVEKYRPTELKDFILSDKNRATIQGVLDKKQLTNMTLFSPTAGSGKTSLAKMLANTFCDKDEILFINGSLDRNIDTVRNEMSDFVYKPTISGNKKVIIIDEADGINKIAQESLRGFIEQYVDETSFILTCNDVTKIISPLISRCPVVNLSIQSSDRGMIAKQIYNRCTHILHDNLIDFEQEAVQDVIKNYFPDIRQTINILQRLSLSGKIEKNMIQRQDSLKASKLLVDLGDYIVDGDWTKIRGWTHDNYNVSNIYDLIYEYLITKIDKSTIGEFIVLIGEYSYRDSVTNYKEVNMSAFLAEVIKNVKFNI